MAPPPVIHEAELRKTPLAPAALIELLAGGFACYYLGSEAALTAMLAYALTVAAMYLKGYKWAIALAASTLASAYGAYSLGGEASALLAVSTALKIASPALRGLLRLRSPLKPLASAVEYLRENPQALFVLPFTALLTAAAALLALGDEDAANRLAEYAYYQLVAGVATALAVVAKEERAAS